MTKKYSLIDYPFLLLSWVAGAVIYYPFVMIVRLNDYFTIKRAKRLQMRLEREKRADEALELVIRALEKRNPDVIVLRKTKGK